MDSSFQIQSGRILPLHRYNFGERRRGSSVIGHLPPIHKVDYITGQVGGETDVWDLGQTGCDCLSCEQETYRFGLFRNVMQMVIKFETPVTPSDEPEGKRSVWDHAQALTPMAACMWGRDCMSEPHQYTLTPRKQVFMNRELTQRLVMVKALLHQFYVVLRRYNKVCDLFRNHEHEKKCIHALQVACCFFDPYEIHNFEEVQGLWFQCQHALIKFMLRFQPDHKEETVCHTMYLYELLQIIASHLDYTPKWYERISHCLRSIISGHQMASERIQQLVSRVTTYCYNRRPHIKHG